MSGESTDRAASGRSWPTAALVAVAFLRIAIGWHFLYEGLVKLFAPSWTAAGYLRSADWLLADLFHWMANSPDVLRVVDLLNVWGLILIGAALMLGVFTRAAALGGAGLLALYYAAHPPLLGLQQGVAEGSYLVVNKNLVEMVALLVLAILPQSGFAGLGRYIAAAFRKIGKTARRAASAGETPLHVDPEGLSRREIVASLATLPAIGGFVFAFLSKRSRDTAEERALRAGLASTKPDAVSRPSVVIPEAQTLDQLKGKVPHAKLGDLDVARIILGGNLMNGFAHARDLMYVSPLVKAYHSVDKVMETLWLAEQCGMNTLIINTEAGGRFVEEYHKRQVGKMQFIAQCTNKDIMGRINRAIDLGAKGAYLQMVSSFVDKGEFDAVAEKLDYLRQNGLVAGVGDHAIAPVKQCVDHGIVPDFVMKTFHHDNYWSARPGDQQKDNRFCDDHAETVEFMKTFDKPWIAFKALAAGSIHPRDGFRHAFENGADFVCVGVYDFQVVEDANIGYDILHAKLKRERPWASEGGPGEATA